jgi:hypothetical protein
VLEMEKSLPWRPPLACGGAGVAPKAPVPQARDSYGMTASFCA